MTAPLLPGTEVAARGLRWEVVSAQVLGPQTLYRLRGLDGALRGLEFDLLHPFEPVEPLVQDLRPEQAGPLVNWLVYHKAFLLEQALGPDALLAVQPGRLRIEPYQLVPVLRAIRMSRARLLLADGVGLGKTIQAGLVITELMARRLAHRVLIVCPAGPLLEQWRTEMVERFGLRLDVIDRNRLEEVRRSTELGANPFDHIPLGLASIDFLKQERVLDQLDRSGYDVVVIDEAHHCMDIGSADREDTLRRRLAEVLARKSDALILITATPHDGTDRSLASLCELLDPSLVDGKGELRGDRYRAHVVRRLKKHVPGFLERIVLPRPVTASADRHPDFIALAEGLVALLAPELRRALGARAYGDALAFIALLKRSVSTVAACRATLEVVAKRFRDLVAGSEEEQVSRRELIRTLRQYHRKLERFGSLPAEEEADRHRLEAEDVARRLADLEREQRRESRRVERRIDVLDALERLLALAEAAEGQDPKLAALAQEIASIRAQEPRANVLVYTEYVDSQEAATRAIRNACLGEVLTLRGEDGDAVRAAVTARFRSEDGLVLVSTDASAEGLNLHQRCHHLIHLELPFNPNRLEQRNGRIDRYGQTQNPVVRYLFLRGTFEERILLRLIAKYERQRRLLTFVPNTLGLTASSDEGAERLLKSLVEEQNRLFQTQPTLFEFTSDDENVGTDPATRELLEEIDRSFKGFERAARTHAWLGEAGLAAEPTLVAAADAARDLGDRAGQVDLARFVIEAVQLDGGTVHGSPADPVFEVVAPVTWMRGLSDLPGYDPASRRFKLTTRLDVTHDATDHPVGFLGRAHPLVRVALDRVRNLSFGSPASAGQDPRASAVEADVDEPKLLYTVLGRVMSKAGREFERVLAVEVRRDGTTRMYDTADQWLPLADLSRAVRPTGLWERHFSAWHDPAGRALASAAQGFRAMAEAFIAKRRADLEAERARQTEWLAQRTAEVIGALDDSESVQLGLFDAPQPEPGRTRPAWAQVADPVERLALFAADATQPARLRSEADAVRLLHGQRLADLERRLAFEQFETRVLGVLMIVPGGARGA